MLPSSNFPTALQQGQILRCLDRASNPIPTPKDKSIASITNKYISQSAADNTAEFPCLFLRAGLFEKKPHLFPQAKKTKLLLQIKKYHFPLDRSQKCHWILIIQKLRNKGARKEGGTPTHSKKFNICTHSQSHKWHRPKKKAAAAVIPKKLGSRTGENVELARTRGRNSIR